MVDVLLDSSVSSNAICTCSSYSWSLRPFYKGTVTLLECEVACRRRGTATDVWPSCISAKKFLIPSGTCRFLVDRRSPECAD